MLHDFNRRVARRGGVRLPDPVNEGVFARGCAVTYYAETDVLVPLDSVAEINDQPTSRGWPSGRASAPGSTIGHDQGTCTGQRLPGRLRRATRKGGRLWRRGTTRM